MGSAVSAVCTLASFSGERQKYRMNKPRRDSLLEVWSFHQPHSLPLVVT